MCLRFVPLAKGAVAIDTVVTLAGVLRWLDIAGVAVFATSGALVASRKCMDPIGFALIATFTGIGGGTLRDLILGRSVFWLYQTEYVVICIGVSWLVYLIAPHIEYRYRVLLWADAVGLSVFATLGASIALQTGFGVIVAVVTGLMTATFGGLFRDVICQEVPLILRREIYATAALFGAAVYALLASTPSPFGLAEAGGILACFILRALAIRHGLSLPAYRPRAGRDYPLQTDVDPRTRASRHFRD